jgi:hypothetical protein
MLSGGQACDLGRIFNFQLVEVISCPEIPGLIQPFLAGRIYILGSFLVVSVLVRDQTPSRG